MLHLSKLLHWKRESLALILSQLAITLNNLNPQDLGAGRKAQPLRVLPYCPRHTAQLNVCPDGLLSKLFVNISPAVCIC